MVNVVNDKIKYDYYRTILTQDICDLLDKIKKNDIISKRELLKLNLDIINIYASLK